MRTIASKPVTFTAVTLLSLVTSLSVSTTVLAWGETAPKQPEASAAVKAALEAQSRTGGCYEVSQPSGRYFQVPCAKFAGNTLNDLTGSQGATSNSSVNLGGPVGGGVGNAAVNLGSPVGGPVGGNVSGGVSNSAVNLGGAVGNTAGNTVGSTIATQASAQSTAQAPVQPSVQAPIFGEANVMTVGQRVITGQPELVSDDSIQTNFQQPIFAPMPVADTTDFAEADAPDFVEADVVAPAPVATATTSTRAFPTLWSYVGGGLAYQRFGFEDKRGERTANIRTANLIAGVQYKKLVGIEARVGLGIGTSDLDFDCGTKHVCDLSLKAPLFGAVLGRLQYASSASITPYVLAGGAYAKLEATLSDGYGTETVEDSGIGFAYGAGLEFMPAEKIRVGLEYIRYGENLSSFGANARYVF